jgi:signal transduction histidine kinase
VDRCGSITQQLLGFARHVDVKIKPVNLKRVAGEVVNFLRTEALLRNIQINVQIPEDFQEIQTDRGKLQQILLNLVNNAFQAMETGGKLDISAQITDAKRVDIVVGDTGCGIPEKDLVKVFDPFFTTKALSGGTGLGLSITYGLVKKLDGTITVSSIVNKGTKFTISIPLSIKEVKEYESPPG